MRRLKNPLAISSIAIIAAEYLCPVNDVEVVGDGLAGPRHRALEGVHLGNVHDCANVWKGGKNTLKTSVLTSMQAASKTSASFSLGFRGSNEEETAAGGGFGAGSAAADADMAGLGSAKSMTVFQFCVSPSFMCFFKIAYEFEKI